MAAKAKFPGWRHITATQRRNARQDAIFDRAYELAARRAGWTPEPYGTGWRRHATAEELKKYPGGDLYARERTAREAVLRDNLKL